MENGGGGGAGGGRAGGGGGGGAGAGGRRAGDGVAGEAGTGWAVVTAPTLAERRRRRASGSATFCTWSQAGGACRELVRDAPCGAGHVPRRRRGAGRARRHDAVRRGA